MHYVNEGPQKYRSSNIVCVCVSSTVVYRLRHTLKTQHLLMQGRNPFQQPLGMDTHTRAQMRAIAHTHTHAKIHKGKSYLLC